MENFNILHVLIAPLDWGLGHTTRCIPIIREFLSQNYKVTVALNSKQKSVLEKENLSIDFIHLEGYDISYAGKKIFFILKIILQIPKILFSIHKENLWLKNYIQINKVDIVISDNRFGFYTKKTKSVFITHQLKIKAKSKFIESILQRINYYFINKFHECWIPDFKGNNSLAGALSNPQRLPKTTIKYIGVLNRFGEIQEEFKNEYDACILLSGPEPQRTILENKILHQIKDTKNILLIRGLPQSNDIIDNKNLTIINHLPEHELIKKIKQSKIVICRSGYTTVMEMIALQKPFIAIATPMQTEQEYLAKYLMEKQICLSYSQSKFEINLALNEASKFDFNFLKVNDKLLHYAIINL